MPGWAAAIAASARQWVGQAQGRTATQGTTTAATNGVSVEPLIERQGDSSDCVVFVRIVLKLLVFITYCYQLYVIVYFWFYEFMMVHVQCIDMLLSIYALSLFIFEICLTYVYMQNYIYICMMMQL